MDSNKDNIVEENKVANQLPEVSEQDSIGNRTDPQFVSISTESATIETADITPEQINWRKFREEREKDRVAAIEAQSKAQAKDAEINALTAAIEQVLSQKGSQSQTKEEQAQAIIDLMDEDIPTGGEVKSYLNQVLPNMLKDFLANQEKEHAAYRAEEEKRNLPKILRQENKDFDTVCTKENLDYLDYHYPEVANAFAAMPDGKNKWNGVYKALKKLVPNVGTSDAKRIERNLAKPQALSGAQSQPSGEGGYSRTLSASQKLENYKKMVELARQV